MTKMNTKHYILLMATALMMAGCAFDDPMEKQKPWVETDPDAPVPVRFSVSTANNVDFTRALTSIVSFDAGEHINVRVKPMGAENYTPYDYVTAGSGQNNVALTAPDPQPYFPAGINSTVDAYAYYPSTALSESTTFTVKDNQSTDENYKASDLMMAENRTVVKITDPNDSHYGDGSTVLNMKHMMAQLRIKAMPGKDSGLTLKGIQVEARKSVTFTPEDETVTETTGDIGTVIMCDHSLLDDEGLTEHECEGYVLIPPQAIGDVKIKVITGSGSPKEIATYAFAADGNFEAGGSYSVNITVTAGQLGLMTAIANWNGMGSVVIAPNGNLVIDPIPTKSFIDDDTPITLILEGEGQELFVRQGDTMLRYGADKDYTVQFLNNTKAGTAYVVVTGVNEYSKYVAVAPFIITQNSAARISYGEFTDTTVVYGCEPFIHNLSFNDGDGTITYTSSDPTVASVNAHSGEVTILKPSNDPVTITANVTDGPNYVYAVSTASYQIYVNKAEGSISFDTEEPEPVTWDSDPIHNHFTQEVTNTGNAEVTYSVPSPGTEGNTCGATIDAATGKVTFTKGGTVVVTAIVEDNEYYTYAVKSASYTLTVGKAEGYVNLSAYNVNVDYNASYSFTITSSHGGAVTVASANTNIATVPTTPTNGTVTITAKGAGTTTIEVTCAATAQYQEAKVEFTVNVGKISITEFTAPTAINNLVYTGSAQTLVIAGSVTDGTGTMKYCLSNSENEEDWSTTLPTGTNAGDYTVYWKVKGDGNHNDYSGSPVNVNIAKAAPTYTAPTSISNLTYSGSQLALVNAGSVTGGTMQYRLSTSSTWSNAIPTATEATTYTVYWQVVGDPNHNDYSGSSVSTTIGKASPVVTTSPALKTGLTYNGSAQDLVTAGVASHGTISYRINNSTTWVSAPKGTNAGTYKVYYKVDGSNSNYSNSDEKYLGEITIAKKSIASSDITLASQTLTYNGSSQTRNVATVAGLSASGNWSVTGGNTGTNAGDYTLTVQMADGCQNYKGSATKTWSIARKSVTLSFKSSAITKDYVWEIKTSSNTLSKSDANCTVSYSSNNTGVASVNSSTGALTPGGTPNTTATITATATGNYSGTATYTIKATSKSKDFSYSGTVQNITLPAGTYKLEVWGAQGGMPYHYASNHSNYAKGGYSYGNKSITSNTTFYVCVGGQGSSGRYYDDSRAVSATTGGYNGGGNGGGSSTNGSATSGGAGGGATHIATSNGTLYSLLNNSSTRSSVLIVAGGGGGHTYHQIGGHGGGATGGSSSDAYAVSVGGNALSYNIPSQSGATSSYYHALGQGQNGFTKTVFNGWGTQGTGGGGGGYYGGKAYQAQGQYTDVGGGGGSGYIGGVTSGSTSAGQRQGHGLARITWVNN